MFNNQNGKCYICGGEESRIDNRTGKIRSLCVDHDHLTGENRKLLCSSCNTALGLFKDNPQLLKKAAKYIDSFKN